ncbi:hypothetical protein B0T25DRAFT_573099 [Lasiosphaeria hispida]|uniref:Uncharacterized protein n=1 Tax=Lasiosphaeria hispida TaxID=260671 RepID=A0AAJ0H987_9PEZI|nr:hypothetical protein B0T25DRAFT_573099 [Lasiosphaeria hispida]
MTLHHIGIGTPSPLLSPLRQGYSNFSSPPAWPPPSPPPLGIIAGDVSYGFSDDEGELTRDSRDVVAERLADLVQHLRGAGSIGGAVDELHAKVDEMEAILGGSPGSIGRRVRRVISPMEMQRQRHQHVGSGSGTMMMSGIFRLEGDGVGGGGSPELVRVLATPPWLAGARFGQVTAVKSEARAEVRSADKLAVKVQRPDVTASVVAEVERLNDTLLEVVKMMKARREESNHIHALLIERAEAAATRILELEKEVADLEEEVGGNESDLRTLRIELRAIEALVPVEADQELVRSIENWKSDLALLREKVSAKKKVRRLRQQTGGGGGDGDSTLLSASATSMSTLGGESPYK